MPLNIIQTLATEGKDAVPYFDQIAVAVPVLGVVSLLKTYFGGSTNTWQRDMHGRVVIMTGGTSGVGAEIARELAQKGAQLILLVREHTTYAAEFVDDLRAASGNELVYMETCDLNDLHSVRKFATKWLDNQPPRRLDTVICCAATATPPSVERKYSRDGIEEMLQVNYLAHYHLLTLLEPALKVQPRIETCVSFSPRAWPTSWQISTFPTCSSPAESTRHTRRGGRLAPPSCCSTCSDTSTNVVWRPMNDPTRLPATCELSWPTRE